MKNDGGSAFPRSELSERVPYGSDVSVYEMYSAQEGMSLRDYFAAHAPIPPRDMGISEHCAFRYRYADEMLKAREQ
jgi:hypothetical protein